MSSIFITPANVIQSRHATFKWAKAGGVITAGMVCYLGSDGRWYEAALLVPLPLANLILGIALQNVGLNQNVCCATRDPCFQFGASVASGSTLWISENAGLMTDSFTDIEGAGVEVIAMGVALGQSGNDTNFIDLNPVPGGTQ